MLISSYSGELHPVPLWHFCVHGDVYKCHILPSFLLIILKWPVAGIWQLQTECFVLILELC